MRHQTIIINKSGLTQRESSVLSLMCSALSDKAIARELGIQLGTVTTYVEQVYVKLGVQNDQLNRRMAALRVALERGIIKLGCVVLSVSMGLQAGNIDAVRVARPGSVRVSARRSDV